MKGVIRILEQLEGRARTEPLDELSHKLKVGERIASSLQEEHRNLYVE